MSMNRLRLRLRPVYSSRARVSVCACAVHMQISAYRKLSLVEGGGAKKNNKNAKARVNKNFWVVIILPFAFSAHLKFHNCRSLPPFIYTHIHTIYIIIYPYILFWHFQRSICTARHTHLATHTIWMRISFVSKLAPSLKKNFTKHQKARPGHCSFRMLFYSPTAFQDAITTSEPQQSPSAINKSHNIHTSICITSGPAQVYVASHYIRILFWILKTICV